MSCRKKRDVLIDVFIYSVLIIVSIITLYPFLNVLAISLNESVDTVKGGIYIWPRRFTFNNYLAIFNTSALSTAFFVSVARTIIGTATGLLSTYMMAYVLSRKDFASRKLFSALFIVTMYVSGGMIPGYLLIRNLGLMNNFLVYIVPGLIWVWNLFILRSYIDTLPPGLQESAKLDGANDLVIMFKILFPLCAPVLATVSLFIAVGQWNSWFDTYIYCGNNEKLVTLQFELMKILQSAQSQISGARMSEHDLQALNRQVSPESIKMAITIVATVPILVVYPFLQKYFVKGLTLGAVKN